MAESAETSSVKLPSVTILQHAAKLAIREDRPIMLDYWIDSLQKEVIIVVMLSNDSDSNRIVKVIVIVILIVLEPP